MTDSAALCCRERPEGGLDGPCTWPATDCYQNGPAMPTVPCVVTGASDDLIEIDGAISEEFPATETDEGDLLAFSTGVVLRVRYTNGGVWRITPVIGAEKVVIELAPEHDDDNYSDRATLAESPSWVVHGIAWAQA